MLITITSNPPGIDCGSDCSEEYEDGTQVTLTMTVDTGWGITDLYFIWDFLGQIRKLGCGTGEQLCKLDVLRSPRPTTLSCTVDIDQPKTVDVTFEPQ